MADPPQEKFHIQSSESFMSRQSSIFDSLNNLEVQHEKRCIDENIAIVPCKADDPTEESFPVYDAAAIRSKRRKRGFDFRRVGEPNLNRQPPEHGFKIPTSRQSSGFKNRQPKIPDHKIHPEKWTKYSLEDVTSDQLTDKANMAAAMDFFEKLKSDKEKASTSIDMDSSTSNEGEDDKTEPTAGRGKWVMPEYVVGAKQKKKNKTKIDVDPKQTKPLRNIKLQHLDEEEEDIT